jgi:psp operon transcriptional activator
VIEKSPAPGQENSATSLPELPMDLRQFQLDQEKSLLEQSLQQAEFNQKRAAERLGLTYHQLRALLKKHQIR